MSEAEQLSGLIKDLRKSSSRVEQLKILTRAWKTVHGLSPSQRVELAKHVGMREGLPLLERLGKPGGVSPAALAQAVMKAEQSKPGQLNQILRDLRTVSSRGRGVRESVEMLDSVLQEAVPDQPAQALKPPAPPRQDAASKGPVPVAPDHVPPPQTRPVEVVRESSETGTTATDSSSSKPKPDPVAAPARQGTPAGQAASVSSLDLVQNPVYPVTPGWGRPFAATEERPLVPPMPAQTGHWTVSGLMKSFRRLDEAIDQDPEIESRFEAVLSKLPPGWPRRRGLTHLIRSGAVSETSKILTAIASLPSHVDEFWCLSAWLHHCQPSREELEEALRQTRGAAGKRLIRVRLAAD